MAGEDFDTLAGKLEIASRPSTLCYGKPLEFIDKLVEIFRATFPVNKNHKFVVYGSGQPGVDDIDKLWAKFSSDGQPQGWFAFIKGTWQRFYTPVPGEIRWIVGDSNNPPAGWSPITGVGAKVTSAILAELTSHYVEISAGRYSYYAVRYVGY